ncbi:hypothetical protein [Streptomyces sp. GESEQ-35]|uniref:hypothetical protein n=1 Tax=Streptomyces sp. GESEQ-35 TaxID=2812657 RepID=UPI001B33645F|nr:hypothetical protein [Streptomyces sp. GESEQ-35]
MPFGHQHDPFENRLGTALRQAGDSFDTDRAALAAAGQVRGRRLWLRRRGAVVGSAAGIALVGVGAAVVAPWGGGDGDGQRSVGVDRTASASSESAAPAAVSGDELLKSLKGLLPEGEFSGEEARGTDELPGPYAHLVYDDGKGPAAIDVSLGRVEPGSDQARQATTCPDKVLTPHDSCLTQRLPGGALLMVLQGYEYPDRRVDTKLWRAEFVTPKGSHVSVSEWNSAAQKGAPISRPEPPLTANTLREVVTAAAWQYAIAAMPEDPEGTAAPETSTPPAAPGPDAIVATLTGLLPKDVEVVTKGTDYSYVVLDDGKGKSYVQVDVQPGMGDVEGELFGSDAETLDDGTKFVSRQSGGDKDVSGAVMWTADTLRTDGLRVVVSAFNQADQHSAPSRETPALTMQELRAIALSPKWADLV